MDLLRQKLVKLFCSLIFLLHCRDQGIIPSFSRVKHHINTRSSNVILNKVSKALFRERIKHTTDNVFKFFHLGLSSILDSFDWVNIEFSGLEDLNPHTT